MRAGARDIICVEDFAYCDVERVQSLHGGGRTSLGVYQFAYVERAAVGGDARGTINVNDLSGTRVGLRLHAPVPIGG